MHTTSKNIGWEHFARGRIRTFFINTITAYYKKVETKGKQFTGVEWVETMARHLLIIHVSSWASHYNTILNGSVQAKGKVVSLHKQSLLIIVEHYYEKAGVLSVDYRK